MFNNHNPHYPAPRPLTDYLLIVDRSGSMETLRDATISAFNEQIATIKAESARLGQDVKVSLVTFSSEVDAPVLWRVPIEQVTPLSRANYQPLGWTAMLDAIGGAVTKLEQETAIERLEPNSTAVVAIYTDGAENHSRTWTGPRVAALIDRLKKTEKWTFTFIGANVDVSAIAESLAIPSTNTRTYRADAYGTHSVSRAMSLDMGGYLGKKAAGIQNLAANYTTSASEDQRT